MGMTNVTLIRTIVILVGALALGIAGVSWGGPTLLGVLVLGVVPMMWGALHLLERSIGRDIWQCDAPYPYRWMSEETDEQVELHSQQPDQAKRPGGIRSRRFGATGRRLTEWRAVH
jgi:hypothetical protein